MIVNTGDDREFYGVHVSPDLDIVTYTLAGSRRPREGLRPRGRLASRVIEALGALGHPTWFRLGDRDLATCLHRTLRLREGAGLAAVTDEVRRALRRRACASCRCPRTPARPSSSCAAARRVHFEEYLARDGAPDEVDGVDLGAARRARPGARACSRRSRRPT